jgi:hypothetical protein
MPGEQKSRPLLEAAFSFYPEFVIRGLSFDNKRPTH